MKENQIPKEELETMSHTDLTYMILKQNKQTMNTPTIFRKICDLLGFSDAEYESKIGDYYTSLTLDKRFVLLENAEWDLRENRSVDLSVDEDDDMEEIDEDESLLEETEEEENIDANDDNDDDLEDDDESLPLNVVDEDDLDDM